MQPLLNGSQNPGHRQHRQHGSLVADGRDLKPENIPDRRLCHSDLVSVQQIGMDHDHPHCRAQKRVPAEFLRGAEANQHGQERKGRVGKGIDGRGQPLPLRVKLDQGLPADQRGGQQVVQSHQQTARHNGRDNGDKNIAEHLDKPLHRVPLLLRFFLSALLHGSQLLLHLVADQIHKARSKNDLELGLCQKHALDPLHIADGLLIPQIVVPQLQAQSCGTVRHGADIALPARELDHLAGNFCIIHNFFLPLSNISGIGSMLKYYNFSDILSILFMAPVPYLGVKNQRCFSCILSKTSADYSVSICFVSGRHTV